MKTRYLMVISLLLGFLAVAAAEEDEKTDSRPFCKTVDEAAKWVLSELNTEDTRQIAHYHEEGLIHLHFTLGMWIRNNVPVWGNEPLQESVGKDVHPDDVGGLILHEYWLLARQRLPVEARKRMEYFENTLRELDGARPEAKTHEGIIAELNSQIKGAWPKDAPYQPYVLAADTGTVFNWEPNEMGEDLDKNVRRFLGYHSSISFYDGDTLRVGIPENEESPNKPDAGAGR
jgi:hypothetical protein